MRHELASEKLLELAYGDLSPREARDVEAHVADCERCREELARIGETRSLMANLPIEPAPERGEGIIMAAAREAAEARGRRRSTLLPPWLWAGSIGAVAAVVLAVVSWQLTREPIRPSLRQDSELMGSARPATSAPAAAPAVAPVQRPVEQPTFAMKEELPAKREPVAKAKALAEPQPPSEEAKGAVASAGAIGILGGQGSPLSSAPSGERRGEGSASESRALPATSRADNARGAAGYAMADAEKAAPAAAPESFAMADKAAPAPAAAKARPPERAANGAAAKAARADAEAEARRLALARSDERKAAAKAAAALRPRQAPGTVEVRKFSSCPGERRRVVEYASDGSLLRYLREGDVRSVEQLFDPDGRLVAAFAIERGVRRALPLDSPGLALDAGDAWIDAPPRCGP